MFGKEEFDIMANSSNPHSNQVNNILAIYRTTLHIIS